MITSNRFRTGFFGLVLVFGLHLFGMAAAIDRQPGECPPPKSTTTDNWEYSEGWFFKWAQNNPQTIDREESVNISVIGGVSPYTWSVSGTGFFLSLDETQGPSNALYADGTACGSADITVKDGYGYSVTGYVRCIAGQWVLVNTCDPGGWDGKGVAIAYVGKYRYNDDWCQEPCNINCLGGPCPEHTTCPIVNPCWIESGRIYEWKCN